MDPKAALARAGVVSGIAQTCALIFAPFVGALADKLTRLMTVFWSAVIALAGYYMMFAINEPIGPEIIIAAILIGCGEVGMIVSSQILVAVEAPPTSRGAISGFYGLCASLGILTATKLGGYLFDNWTEGAPFLIFAIANTLVAILSLVVYLIRRRRGAETFQVVE
jgi:MFS family permease